MRTLRKTSTPQPNERIGKLINPLKMTDADAWYIIPCPSTVELTCVCKERGTHGSVYCLWECERRLPVWIGQSIPALVRSINEKAVMNETKRLHASSLYRCLRKEARKESHKNWKVEKFSRAQVEDLNVFISSFPSAVFISKSPELWKCGPPPASASGSAARADDVPQEGATLPQSPSGGLGASSIGSSDRLLASDGPS